MSYASSCISMFLLGVGASVAWSQTATFDERAAQGRDLFVHQWQPNDPLTPNGDGLGPVYNATSCVACHSQGGIGGSGTPANNVELLAVVPDPGQPNIHNEKAFLNRLGSTHPMFASPTGGYYLAVLLHRHSTTPGYEEAHAALTEPLELNADSRTRVRRMLNRRGMAFMSQLPLKLVAPKQDLQFAIAERNPPQLFGADLIDRNIKDTDILAIAESQRGSPNGVSGRFTGRFGWRGQIDDLKAFVTGACAAELGLQVQEMKQAPDPLRLDYHLENSDLDSQQTESLVSFVRSLPRPQFVAPDDPNERSYASQGKVLFNQIGCTECHVKDVGNVEEVYSDFLLHDMGPDFEDPIPARPVPSYTVLAGISDVLVKLEGKDRNTNEKRPGERNGGSASPVRSEYLDSSGGMQEYYGVELQMMSSQMQLLRSGLVDNAETLQEVAGNDYRYRNKSAAVREMIRFQSQEERNHYREYRTPPLWGVADSAPYLHDGRAETLRAAIELHGGEAYNSMMAFSSLSEEQQTAVLKFLEALKAPTNAEPVPDRIVDKEQPVPPADDKLSALR